MAMMDVADRVQVEETEHCQWSVSFDGRAVLTRASHEEAEEYAAHARAELQRQAFIDGLRELADFLEETPAAPTPRSVWATHNFWPWASEEESADRFAEAVLVLDRGASVDGHQVKAVRMFGPVKLEISIDAKEICEQRSVTMTREEFVLPTSLQAEAA